MVNTLVLRLKAAESFLETKIRISRCEKSRFYPVLATIFIKKNVRNHSYHRFYPVLAKIRINRDLLYITRSELVTHNQIGSRVTAACVKLCWSRFLARGPHSLKTGPLRGPQIFSSRATFGPLATGCTPLLYAIIHNVIGGASALHLIKLPVVFHLIWNNLMWNNRRIWG